MYEFFLRFIVSSDVDPKVAKKYIDKSFLIKVTSLSTVLPRTSASLDSADTADIDLWQCAVPPLR
eukprot:COSAG03_NODE_5236_length_1303_cov_1.232558_3_plen_64_part_01